MSIFFCAEIGINHNGDLDTCKKLIDVAVDAKCNAIKLQKRDIDLVYTKEFLDSPRDSPWGTTQRDQKEGLEFNYQDYSAIDKYCKSKNIEWYASAWDCNSQKFLRQFNCKYNKVASAMIVYEDLLIEIAKERKHTFISTGMCTYKDIQKAIDIFKKFNCPFELMHTISTYPTNYKDVNLNLINTLRFKFSCDVGYSGHETGLAITYAAAAMNVSSIERHITLDRAMYGSDQAASLEPSGLKQLVGGIRKIEKALGSGEKQFIQEEIKIAKKLRQHITL